MNIIGLAKPLLLDLFCGAGGSAMGYHRAGFEVVGVDNKPQKRYPFRFIEADALDYVAGHGWKYAAIHASPPCQAHSRITPDKSKHVDLIPSTRYWLEALGLPYVIENVPGAAKVLRNPIMVCGADFGLKVYRHRFFESNIMLLAMPHVPHRDNTPRAGHGISSKGFISVTSGGKSLEVKVNPAARRRSGLYGVSAKGFVSIAGHFTGLDYCKKAMGIEWMTAAELSQAIPPAYTFFIGQQLIRAVQGKAPAVETWNWQTYVQQEAA